MSIEVTGAPGDTERLHHVLQRELDDLVANGPTPEETANAFEAVGREYDYVTVDEIAAVLMAQRDDPDAVGEYLARRFTLDDLSGDDLADFVVRVLPPNAYVEVVVHPTEEAEASSAESWASKFDVQVA